MPFSKSTLESLSTSDISASPCAALLQRLNSPHHNIHDDETSSDENDDNFDEPRNFFVRRSNSHGDIFENPIFNMSNQHDAEDAEHKLSMFDPPLYVQRYFKVLEVLNRKNLFKNSPLESPSIDTVIDLGCSSGKLISHLYRNIDDLRRVVGVDLDYKLLISRTTKTTVEPLNFEFLDGRRSRQAIDIQLICGDVLFESESSNPVDVVTAIELVEHLQADDVDKLASTILDKLQPKVAIVSTPNKEFNVNFENNCETFLRHPDHKFEWTRDEFSKWCEDAVRHRPYTFELDGVGHFDKDVSRPHSVGPCSQFVFFFRENENITTNDCVDLKKNCVDLFGPSSQVVSHWTIPASSVPRLSDSSACLNFLFHHLSYLIRERAAHIHTELWLNGDNVDIEFKTILDDCKELLSTSSTLKDVTLRRILKKFSIDEIVQRFKEDNSNDFVVKSLNKRNDYLISVTREMPSSDDDFQLYEFDDTF